MRVQWSPPLVWSSLLPGWSGHIREVVSHQGDIYTKMWDLAPDFGSLITGGIAQRRESHNRGSHCIVTVLLHCWLLFSHKAVETLSWCSHPTERTLHLQPPLPSQIPHCLPEIALPFWNCFTVGRFCWRQTDFPHISLRQCGGTITSWK